MAGKLSKDRLATVLTGVLKAKTDSEMAAEIGIKEGTIKQYVLLLRAVAQTKSRHSLAVKIFRSVVSDEKIDELVNEFLKGI